MRNLSFFHAFSRERHPHQAATVAIGSVRREYVAWRPNAEDARDDARPENTATASRDEIPLSFLVSYARFADNPSK
jgi:hypothetical protein